MKTYLINTFKKTSTAGQHLDFISTIKSQEWVVFNDDKNYVEKFLFVDDSKLLVSVNGKSSYSKWEYIKINSSLVIDDEKNRYLLNIVVCNKDIIVLNIDSTDSYSFLINSKSSSLKDATYEDIQWYLVRQCGIDILTDNQRDQLNDEKRHEEERKKKEAEENEKDLKRMLKILGIFGVIIIAIIITVSLVNVHQEYKKRHPDIHLTHEENMVAVDLGLSVKWATCNIGANSPEEFGNYYGWGEPTGTDVFESSGEPVGQLNKRFPSREFNTQPPYSIVNTSKDIAQQNWGGKWRMPTKQEVQELLDKSKITFSTFDGRKVAIIKGPNGNSIVLPSAGFLDGTNGNWRLNYDEYSIYVYIGELYFDVSTYEYADNQAAYLFMGDSYIENGTKQVKKIEIRSIERYRMLPVRAVIDK